MGGGETSRYIRQGDFRRLSHLLLSRCKLFCIFISIFYSLVMDTYVLGDSQCKYLSGYLPDCYVESFSGYTFEDFLKCTDDQLCRGYEDAKVCAFSFFYVFEFYQVQLDYVLIKKFISGTLNKINSTFIEMINYFHKTDKNYFQLNIPSSSANFQLHKL